MQIEIGRLAMNPSQRSAIGQIYSGNKELSLVFSEGSVSEQAEAQSFLRLHGLDLEARSDLESRWNIQWSTRWSLKTGSDTRRRSLYQWRNPYEYTGCMAHLEVTEREGNGAVTRIVGVGEHNTECTQSVMARVPAIPLHPHVYEVALAQLQQGASISVIQSTNMDMLRSRSYRGMSSHHQTATSNVRYNFMPTDTCHLYRLYNKSHGVDVTIPPEHNLNDWLDPSSPSFRQEIHDAIFHYAARTEKGERLKVCISTPDMDDAAWKYAHGRQLILDGTFGVCSSRLLLFIAMGIDEEGKGVPLAFFLFSAPTGNKATHAGYNREILRELLTSWRGHLSRGRPTLFRPLVAITDTDTKERSALLDVWPELWLILCRFHVRQCWTNHRKKLFKEMNFWQQYFLHRLLDIEVR
ncbi:hypothetical protein FIBSPDRAFT_730771 [Athelia psychrophila]|uniref:MULE transposase domain-containing protein n=1 Tax=Athelia psychrophila TaxID=1759441 RepID=A0A166QT30_9AGAM|nr:hypothetical protein FIBSPDRAFT_730771 [Fibularhizoctonia sp. CBS 109695]